MPPSGSHIASGSDDGTFITRIADSGKSELSQIETSQKWVLTVVFSSSGDRVALSKYNRTIFLEHKDWRTYCLPHPKPGNLCDIIGVIIESSMALDSIASQATLQVCLTAPQAPYSIVSSTTTTCIPLHFHIMMFWHACATPVLWDTSRVRVIVLPQC